MARAKWVPDGERFKGYVLLHPGNVLAIQAAFEALAFYADERHYPDDGALATARVRRLFDSCGIGSDRGRRAAEAIDLVGSDLIEDMRQQTAAKSKREFK